MLKIRRQQADGHEQVLKEKVPVLAGEVVDATMMSVAALREFYAAEIEDAKAQDVLFSLHLKATMMKVSDPIIFGHAVKVFYKSLKILEFKQKFVKFLWVKWLKLQKTEN